MYTVGCKVQWKSISGVVTGRVKAVNANSLVIQPTYCAGGFGGTVEYPLEWVTKSTESESR